MDDAEKVKKAIELLSSVTSSQTNGRQSSTDSQQDASVSAQSTQTGVNLRQRVASSCSRAVNTLRSIRESLAHSSRNVEVRDEQKSNFAPYNRQHSKKQSKPQSWTVKVFCLSSKFARKVPVTIYERETLVASGLGEKKVVIPNIDCSWDDFKDVLCMEFPKLKSIGGFEILRCIPNTKDLEVISSTISQSPKLLKGVIANGRIFIRPIQKDLVLDEELLPSSQVTEKCIHCDSEVPVQELS